MKAKIIEILEKRLWHPMIVGGSEWDAYVNDLADTIDQLYEQERRNAFARGVDWLVHRMHVPQSETR